ncbi:MAG: hypothetical protein HY819_02045 [Acidobacteria bacterium]|nr:hypothetical protein [Acidobacteriota bacterium]
MGNLSGKSCLEKLACLIPGYGGYLERERRRDVDKLHRENLAQQLEKIKTPLTSLVRELSDTSRLLEVKHVERVNSKLDKIANRIRYASYGYSGFFDTVKINELELDRLYQFDLALTESLEAIKEKVSSLIENASNVDMKNATTALERMLDELDAHFSERNKVIENIL